MTLVPPKLEIAYNPTQLASHDKLGDYMRFRSWAEAEGKVKVTQGAGQ